MNHIKLVPVSLGLALGVVGGASALAMGILLRLFMNGKPVVAAVGQMYVGFNPSFFSSIIGGLLGFVGSFIAGIVIAWLYNMFNVLLETLR